jgi:hypothetical protein
MVRQVSVRQAASGASAVTARRGSHMALQGLVVLLLVVLAFGLGLLPSFLYSQRQLTFTSTAYHFSIRYPANWSASSIPQPSEVSPLTLVIAKTHSPQDTAPAPGQASGALVSTLTVVVLSLSNPGIAASVQALPSNPSMQKTTLAGVPAYKAADVDEQSPDAQVVDVHIDYYVVHGQYEYQISTDAISNDPDGASELQAMLKSFTFLP